MILVDGSHGEGGGQIIRTALALSSIKQVPFRAVNIRHGRKKPGLKAQHVHAIRALKKLCSATAVGASLGSETLEFYPRKLKGGTINIDVGTAGSLTLVLQSLLLPAFFTGSRVRFKLTGGTDVPFSPSADYLIHVFAPQLRKFCDKLEIKLLRRGYVPSGDGQMEVLVKAHSLEDIPAIQLDKQGSLLQIRGISHASADLQSQKVAERQAHSAKVALSPLKGPISITAEYSDSSSTGSGITLWASYADHNEVNHLNPVILGSSALGARGKRAEEVGKQAADSLLKEITSAADIHLADQLIPFLALFGGSLKTSEISSHTKSNIYSVEKFLGKKINVDGNTISSQ